MSLPLRTQAIYDATERAVNMGLGALAVSDLLLCVCLIPDAFVDNQFHHPSISFALLYRAYGSAVINTFILTSTWLTVTMAAGRYMAICHPFKVDSSVRCSCRPLRVDSSIRCCCHPFKVDSSVRVAATPSR